MNTIIQTIQKYRNIVIGSLLLIGLFVAYNIFYLQPKKDQDGGILRAESQSIIDNELGQEVITTLNQLKNITIDLDFFQDQRFTRLVDFSIELQERPVGKSNPFKKSDAASISREQSAPDQTEAPAGDTQESFFGGNEPNNQ